MTSHKKPYRIILSGGGTGGHIFPAVSIADELRRRHPDAEILFVGAQGRMEMTRVPEAGYRIVGLPIAGIQRSLSLSNLAVPFKVISSLWRAAALSVGSVPMWSSVQEDMPALRCCSPLRWRGFPPSSRSKTVLRG